MLRRLAPFVLAATLAFVMVAGGGRVGWIAYGAAAAALLGTIALTILVPWTRLPSMAQVSPSLVFLLSAALLRHSGGGIASGVGILALLPVFWIALHGTRGQLAVVLMAVAVFYLGPSALIGGSAYPASGYRTGVLIVVVGGIIGLAVQRLVEQVRLHAEEVVRHVDDLQRVAVISRQLATSSDARLRVCEAAVELGSATFAFLMEPDGEGGLASTAMAGLDAPRVHSAPALERPPTLTAFATAQPVFIADTHGYDDLNHALWSRHGRPASMLFQPVLRDGGAVGVLVIGWVDRIPGDRRPAMVSLLAGEAAVAIEAADRMEKLTTLASIDALTGVPNRRGWDEQLAEAFGEPDARPLCVALLDLDNFKAFNDARGHQSGDRLLKEAAASWRSLLRPGDALARYGGEEFAILLCACELAPATVIVDRLRATTPGNQTCSAGIAVWDGQETPESLVHRADQALYAAKNEGRNRTVSA